MSKSIEKLNVKQPKDVLPKLPDSKDELKKVIIPPKVELDPSLTTQEIVWYQWLPKALEVGKVLFKNTVVGNIINAISIIKGETTMSALSSGVKSWKTTVFGAGGVAIVIFNQLSTLLDGDPTTNPDWTVVVSTLGILLAFLFSRDANKSSEDSGVN